ncbi:MAG: putative hydrolase [Myxococcaceae bacterium]|nr:putative hydrolase [Myxococcaceae bacterium]
MHFSQQGAGRPVLVLHGGGGPATVSGLVENLAKTRRVLAATLPGWNATPRPAELTSVAAYADAYAAYLVEQGLTDVTVIGSSVGGWIAAELALRDPERRISGLVIINGAGIEVAEHPITNISGFTPPQLAKVAYHDPSKFGAGMPPPTAELLTARRANEQTLLAIAGEPYMCDPTLRARLVEVRTPTLVLWGESDRVMTADYGRAYAAAIPGAAFELVPEAGHLPQLERPAETFRRIEAFLAGI